MKKIVISCASGFKNSGDEAILQAILENIDSSTCSVKVISFDPEYTKKMHLVEAIPHFDKKNHLWKEAILECDLFIMGGGGLLQDETTVYNISFWLQKLKFAIKHDKKTYVFANSLGPINYKFNHNKIMKVLKNTTFISVRDKQSFEYLRENNINQVELTSDPVFALHLIEERLSTTMFEKYQLNEKYVVISLRHWFDTIPLIPVKVCVKFNLKTRDNQRKYENYRYSFEQYVRFLNERYGYQVVFVPMCSGRDEKIANEILAPITNFKNISIEDELTPLEIIELIKRSQFVLGMRLHSLIYAIRVGKPFVALIYSSKVRGILELANLSEYSVEIKELSANQLVKVTELLMYNRQAISNKVDKIGKDFYDLAMMNYTYLTEIINSDKNAD